MNELSTTEREDRIHREGVLMFLLDETPLATVEEIVVCRLAFERPERHQQTRDDTERAINELASIGVLNVEGRTVWVSRAAREAVRVSEGPKPEGAF